MNSDVVDDDAIELKTTPLSPSSRSHQSQPSSKQSPSSSSTSTSTSLGGSSYHFDPATNTYTKSGRYPCPAPNCIKAYRDRNGLKYHLKVQHPGMPMPKTPRKKKKNNQDGALSSSKSLKSSRNLSFSPPLEMQSREAEKGQPEMHAGWKMLNQQPYYRPQPHLANLHEHPLPHHENQLQHSQSITRDTDRHHAPYRNPFHHASSSTFSRHRLGSGSEELSDKFLTLHANTSMQHPDSRTNTPPPYSWLSPRRNISTMRPVSALPRLAEAVDGDNRNISNTHLSDLQTLSTWLPGRIHQQRLLQESLQELYSRRHGHDDHMPHHHHHHHQHQQQQQHHHDQPDMSNPYHPSQHRHFDESSQDMSRSPHKRHGDSSHRLSSESSRHRHQLDLMQQLQQLQKGSQSVEPSMNPQHHLHPDPLSLLSQSGKEIVFSPLVPASRQSSSSSSRLQRPLPHFPIFHTDNEMERFTRRYSAEVTTSSGFSVPDPPPRRCASAFELATLPDIQNLTDVSIIEDASLSDTISDVLSDISPLEDTSPYTTTLTSLPPLPSIEDNSQGASPEFLLNEADIRHQDNLVLEFSHDDNDIHHDDVTKRT